MNLSSAKGILHEKQWSALQALAVKQSTTTPMWKGLEVMLKYRTRNNYMSPYYLFGRLFDKLMCALASLAKVVGRDCRFQSVPFCDVQDSVLPLSRCSRFTVVKIKTGNKLCLFR